MLIQNNKNDQSKKYNYLVCEQLKLINYFLERIVSIIINIYLAFNVRTVNLLL